MASLNSLSARGMSQSSRVLTVDWRRDYLYKTENVGVNSKAWLGKDNLEGTDLLTNIEDQNSLFLSFFLCAFTGAFNAAGGGGEYTRLPKGSGGAPYLGRACPRFSGGFCSHGNVGSHFASVKLKCPSDYCLTDNSWQV
ncbi:hypothetical protein H5410_034885 [Solanum commersonii]|uniref:Uncharacterized protein n=1 Tax=Solanum commersonii TaxID=4109 RepID=A0A9J5Y0D4_SOLCO|nr:hypothetical protein H5410_034885 [Solanum commersonii]